MLLKTSKLREKSNGEWTTRHSDYDDATPYGNNSRKSTLRFKDAVFKHMNEGEDEQHTLRSNTSGDNLHKRSHSTDRENVSNFSPERNLSINMNLLDRSNESRKDSSHKKYHDSVESSPSKKS